MWDESTELYPLAGGAGRVGRLDWAFPSGAKMTFSHLQHEKNVQGWQGSQVPFIAFDELTHFSERQFWYMLSRNRSMCGVKPYIRAATNPDADSWVAKLVAWYIDQDTGYAIPERSGVVRWFVRISGELHWADTPDALIAEHGAGTAPKSFTFIAASIFDNQELLRRNPEYLANLKALPLVDQERLLKGNWKIRPEAGKVFNRSWFRVIEVSPVGGEVVRFWDLAASEKKTAGDDPDWTVGLRLRAYNRRYYVEDVVRERKTPSEIDSLIENVASQDGVDVKIRFEQEGGASGKRDGAHLVRMLAGYDVQGIPPRGDKVTRSKPAAAQALAGNIDMAQGDWVDELLRELHGFPDLPHDDQVDALSGAFNAVAGDLIDDVEGIQEAFGWTA